MSTRSTPYRLLLTATIALTAFAALIPFQNVFAAPASEWRAGRIIDDGLFTNAYDMSVADVQNFLNQRVSACDMYGSGISELGGVDYNGDGKVTRREYAQYRGYGNSYVFTCLKDFYEVPKTQPGGAQPANNYGGKPIPAGAQSAAQIIVNSAIKYNINPKALLVKLATESPGPLTSDDWPFERQYLYAMGAHCPDSGPGGAANCDPNWSGFSLQMDEAAALLRWYLDSMNQQWWQYKKPYQTNHILWNVVERGCGGGDVYVESKATAALYTYTPYQPNQAALNNMYGTGDYCSAYGNRNFWRVWYDWFGPTSYQYRATFYEQTSAPALAPGQSGIVSFKFRNDGASPWYDDASPVQNVPRVHMATSYPVNRYSNFSAAWPHPARSNVVFNAVYNSTGTALSGDQHTVYPGQIAEYSVRFTVPEWMPPGVYPEVMQPVADGSQQWNMLTAVQTNIVVRKPYDAALVGQSHGTITGVQNSKIDTPFVTKFRNTGALTWYDDVSAPQGSPRVHLATAEQVNRSSVFGANWPHPARPAVHFTRVYEADGVTLATNQHVVQPGQVAEYAIDITINEQQGWGLYGEYFKVVADGAAQWDTNGLVGVTVQVHAVNHIATPYQQSPATTLLLNESTSAPTMAFRNDGNSIWYDDVSATPRIYRVHLATDTPMNRSSAFSSGWVNSARPALQFLKVTDSSGALTANQHVVYPGQVGFFSVPLTNRTLSSGQTAREYFTPVLENSYRWRMTNQLYWLDIVGR